MARRILIIDDEQGIRAALGQLLEFEGYEVRAVGNAVDGLAEYAKQRPDLVFLDVKMAGIDGVADAQERANIFGKSAYISPRRADDPE